ncbi:MAG TPA: hypothetical protein VII27_06280 [Thermoplasmata archaeon]
MAAVVAEVDSKYVGMFFRLRRILGTLGRERTPDASLSGGAVAWKRGRDAAVGTGGHRA